MAQIDQTRNQEKEICWGRGDSDPKVFAIQDSDGDAVDITGFTFKLTVNAEKDPPDQDEEQFSITGTIISASGGTVSFAPTTTDTNIAPGIYFYDIEQIDTGARIKTLIKGKCIIVQDITKV